LIHQYEGGTAAKARDYSRFDAGMQGLATAHWHPVNEKSATVQLAALLSGPPPVPSPPGIL